MTATSSKTTPRRFAFNFDSPFRTVVKPLLLLNLLGLSPGSAHSRSEQPSLEQIEALPSEIPELLTPRGNEVPESFTLVEDAEILEVMGMDSNPGYITNRSETAALAERGALCSFAAVYQDDKGVALIVNGIYFRDPTDFENFWKDQKEKDLRIVAFQGPAPNGYWLVLLGGDPKREYTEEEVATIKQGMSLYADRLELSRLFSTFSLSPDGDSPAED